MDYIHFLLWCDEVMLEYKRWWDYKNLPMSSILAGSYLHGKCLD